jgi:hypothetical protein
MPFTLERRVGRFVEIAFTGALTLEDAQQLRTRLWTMLSSIDGRAVVWADLRRTELFTAEVAAKLLEMLKVDNPKVERSAYPVGAKATFALQVERIVAEAAAVAGRIATRRTFRDLRAAAEWLREVLVDPAERARLAALVEAG